MSVQLKAVLLAGVNLLLEPSEVLSIVLQWSGNGASMAWSDSANWKADEDTPVPDEADEVVKFKKGPLDGEVIDLGGGSYQLHSLLAQNGCAFTLTNGSLDTSGSFEITRGTELELAIAHLGAPNYSISGKDSLLIIAHEDALGLDPSNPGRIRLEAGGASSY